VSIGWTIQGLINRITAFDRMGHAAGACAHGVAAADRDPVAGAIKAYGNRKTSSRSW
jgi:hypothetical protein